MNFLGIDASLTRTGWCILDASGKVVASGTLKPEAKMRGLARLSYLRGQLADLLAYHSPISAAAIEGYAFGVRGGRLADLAEWGGQARMQMYDRKIPLIVVPPTTLKKYLVGGKLEKNQVLLQVFRQYGVECATDDEADALVLADMARNHYLGTERLIERKKEAISKAEVLVEKPVRKRTR